MMPPDARLLHLLRHAPGWTPLSELASEIGSDFPSTHARIETLREAGFEIDEQPALGFRLNQSPDRLVADDIWSRLGPCPGIREILAFAETASTNHTALRLGQSGARPGLVIFAEHQTAGRGRFSRSWDSRPGLGLWFSMLVRPDLPLAMWPRITTTAAVAVATTVEQTTGVSTAIKWPNDVQIDGRKIAGILCEIATEGSHLPFAVVGVGLNVNHSAADFPADLLPTASSISLATRSIWNRAELAASLIRALAARFDQMSHGFDDILAVARAKSTLLGKPATVAVGPSRIEGIAEDLDQEGMLILRSSDGERHVLASGEASIAS